MGSILAFIFLVVPILELAVIVAVGSRIGTLETLAVLIAVSVAGAALAKRQGLAVWARFRLALAKGEVPSQEIIDGFLILLAGALLLTPGFLTDVAGLTLLTPPGRQAARRLAGKASRAYLSSRLDNGSGRADSAKARRVEVVRIDPIDNKNGN